MRGHASDYCCHAGFHSRLNLLGVSTVAGNQTVEKVTLNALGTLTAAGLSSTGICQDEHGSIQRIILITFNNLNQELPLIAALVQGQAKPLLRPALLCPAIHGESGLEFAEGGSMQDYAAGTPLSGKAVLVMFERISAQHKKRFPSGPCCPMRLYAECSTIRSSPAQVGQK